MCVLCVDGCCVGVAANANARAVAAGGGGATAATAAANHRRFDQPHTGSWLLCWPNVLAGDHMLFTLSCCLLGRSGI